jgi:hypothetical protein
MLTSTTLESEIVISQTDMDILEEVTASIPFNEGKRLKILKETGLINSDRNDPNFDCYTSLAKRLFHVISYFIQLIILSKHINTNRCQRQQ